MEVVDNHLSKKGQNDWELSQGTWWGFLFHRWHPSR